MYQHNKREDDMPTRGLFCITVLTLLHYTSSADLQYTDVGVIATEDSSRHHRAKREVTRDIVGFNHEQKMLILRAHNNYRSVRKASDMMMMEWNSDLEYLAQKYAEECIFEHSPDRSNKAGFSYVGENLYAGTAEFDPADVIKAWYDEVKDYSYSTMGCTGVCGHYTQVVWASSRALGCGVKYCPTLTSVSFGRGYNVVCHYGPGGNYVGQRPYRTGETCSKCPEDAKFCVQGLCALRPMIGSGASGLRWTTFHQIPVLLLLVVIACYKYL